MKIDPYKNKERYTKWKEDVKDVIPGVSKQNSDIILRYLSDMEKGLNISSVSVKGGRSYVRLISLKERLKLFSRMFEEKYNIMSLTNINEEQLVSFFSDLKTGAIKRRDGKIYKSVQTYVKIFKSFWHWYQKVSRKKGIEIQDITLDLDTRQDKPDWVYLTEKEVKKLCDNAKPRYKALIMFLFDTGIRSPTELVNVKVSDLFNDFKELNIRDEVSKTFGRRIKLMLCSNIIKEHIEENNLQKEDYIFPISPSMTNKYLKRLAVKVLGDKETPAGSKTSELTMYDFRHISCCYWLPRYKSESALKYRFGWKKSDKIHYYSELLGMKDTISEDDMLIDLTKTEIEKRLEKNEKEDVIKDERIKILESELSELRREVHNLIESSKSFVSC